MSHSHFGLRLRAAALVVASGLVPALLSASGPVGSSFPVGNDLSTGLNPAIAMTPQGHALVAWSGFRLGEPAILLQRYDTAGAPFGEPLVVNPAALNQSPAYPDVALAPDTSHAIAWHDYFEESGRNEILVQVNGLGGGTGFRIADPDKDFKRPAIALNDRGDLVVAWLAVPVDGSANTVGAQLFHADHYGAPYLPVGPQRNFGPVNGSDPFFEPAVAINADGNAVVVWTKSFMVVRAALPADGGAPQTWAISPSGPRFTASEPAVDMAQDGSYVIAWQGRHGDTFDVSAQRFDAGGAPIGTPFPITGNGTGGTRTGTGQLDVAMALDGGYAVAWGCAPVEDNSCGIVLRRFDASGAAVSTRVDDLAGRSAGDPAIALDGTGDLMVAWTSVPEGESPIPEVRGRLFMGPPIDLRLSIQEAQDPVQLGGLASYHLHVSGAAAHAADDLVVAIALSGDGTLEFAGGDGWTCEGGGELLCQYSSSVPDLENQPLFVDVRGPATPGTVTVQASVSERHGDPDPSNNTATETTTFGDVTPDPFDFGTRAGVERGSTQTSDEVVITGLGLPVPIYIYPGLYSINGGPYMNNDSARVQSGDVVRVQHTAGDWGATVTSTVVIGDGQGSFTTTAVARDAMPDPFAFESRTDVPSGTFVVSNAIIVSGVNDSVGISVNPDNSSAYSVDGRAFRSSPGTVAAGQSVRVRHLSASTASTSVSTTLTVGDASAVFTSTTDVDTTPDAFTFSDVTGVARSTVVTSTPVTVSGINQAAPIAVTGGSYSINGGAYTSAAGTVTAGQLVRVRHTSAATFSTATHTTLTIGGVADTFTSTTRAADTVPDAFVFADRTDVAPSAVMASNAIIVSGIEDAAPISVTGGSYSIDGGAFTVAAGSVGNGQSVRVQHTASSSFGASVSTTLTVGGVSDTFTTTTAARDVVPDAFTFTAQGGVALNTVVQSNEITVSGINDLTPISVSGGSYSVNGGAWTSSNALVSDGHTVRLRHTSAAAFSTTTQTTLDIGGVTATFASTTEAEDRSPDPFDFTDQSGALPMTQVTSNTVTVRGINTSVPIAISGGGYSVNGGVYTTAPGTVSAGDTVRLQATSALLPQESVTVTVSIGTGSDSWSVKTLP